jgi:hypothetical protein
VANVFEPEWDVELPAPWRLRMARVGHHAGSERLGASVYEIEPGGVVSPLHTHFANEEMVIACLRPARSSPARRAPRARTRSATAATRWRAC